MGLNQTAILVEFNGLPGCGKTTIANELLEELRSLGYAVATHKELLHHRVKVKKLDLFKSLLDARNRKFFNASLLLCFSTRPFKLGRIQYARNAYVYYYTVHICRKERKEYDFIICDQGLLQVILSIIHMDKINKPKTVQKMLEDAFAGLGTVILVNCKVKIDTAKERIRLRKLKCGRLDYITEDEKLVSALTRQECCLETIRNMASNLVEGNVLELDMHHVVDKNLQTILKRLQV
ncbi:AAA family ATPase [Clostridia bacterium]|nr:AAA family ATPase [Clostridia bacterium]